MRVFPVHAASGQTLVITMLVLGFLTLTFTLIGFSSVSNESRINLVFEHKASSAAAAVGCMEQAMNRLGMNVTYPGNETLAVASSTCTVRPVMFGNGTWTLETWAQSGDQYTRYRTILTNRTPISISSWTEVADF